MKLIRFFPLVMVARFLAILMLLAAPILSQAGVSDPGSVFQESLTQYQQGDFAKAAEGFESLIPENGSAAVYYNLANAEYQQGDYGSAILHYEQARVLKPGNPDIRANLKLARDTANLAAPSLNFLERLALHAPVNTWAWAATISFWIAVALILLPGLWGLRGIMLRAATVVVLLIFIFCNLGMGGYHTLGKLGVAVDEIPLTLSPTSTAPAKGYLKPGETASIQRDHGSFYFVETSTGKSGWVSGQEFHPIWH